MPALSAVLRCRSRCTSTPAVAWRAHNNRINHRFHLNRTVCAAADARPYCVPSASLEQEQINSMASFSSNAAATGAAAAQGTTPATEIFQFGAQALPEDLFLAKHNYVIVPGSSQDIAQASAEAGQKSGDVPFQADEYLRTLPDARTLGRPLLYLPVVTSTQVLMFERNANIPNGTVMVADVQQQGKGRGKNVWTSPKGCLMFSVKTCFSHGPTLPFVQYIVSLAIVKGIKSFESTKDLDVRIKWPNDIYVNGNTKIGGILCQSSYHDGHFHVISGAGINIDNAEPTTCVNSLIPEGMPKVGRGELLAKILVELEQAQGVLTGEVGAGGASAVGFNSFHAEYVKHWLHSGQRVQVDITRTHKAVQQEQERLEAAAAAGGGGGGDATSVEPVLRETEIVGLAASGALAAKDVATGEMYELYPDGNSFDFFQGLITRKVT